MHVKKDEGDSILEKSMKNADGVVDPITGEVYYSFEEYTNSLKKRTGIDIYELVEKPYFHKYMNFLHDYKSFFMMRIREDKTVLDEARRLWEEIIELSDESDQHPLYQKYEKISILFFGDNFNHIEIYEGIKYRIALDKLKELTAMNSNFKSHIINEYPHFRDLPIEDQDALIETCMFGWKWWILPGMSECESIDILITIGNYIWEHEDTWKGSKKKIGERLKRLEKFLIFLENIQC